MSEKKLLKNNILLITEKSDSTKTVSVGFWFRVGSRNEPSDRKGISHLTEHMIFKGTPSLTTRDIAVTFDKTGGFANAFTEKENVCMHFTVPAINGNLSKALSVFCDMAQNAAFPVEEFEREKEVVKKEIITVREDPEEAALDEVAAFVWKDKGLSRNISGSEKDVDSLTREQVVEWYEKYFVNGELTVCAAGCFDEKEIICELEKLSVKKLSSLEAPSCGLTDNAGSSADKTASFADKDCSAEETDSLTNSGSLAETWNSGILLKKSEFNQEQFFMLYPYQTPFNEKEYWSLVIFNALSGDTMSSRLFEKLREKSGFCYSVYSFFTIYKNEFAWCAYASSEKKRAVDVTKILADEMDDILKNSVLEEEIEIARKHVIGEETISSEDTDYVMKRLFRNLEMHFSLRNTDDTIKVIESVTKLDVENAVSRLIKNEDRAFVMYGPSVKRSDADKIRRILK